MMKHSLILRIIGSALICIGFALVANPELVSNKPIPSDTFEAIERGYRKKNMVGAVDRSWSVASLPPPISTLVANARGCKFCAGFGLVDSKNNWNSTGWFSGEAMGLRWDRSSSSGVVVMVVF